MFHDGKISVRTKIAITNNFRFHCRPIQIVVFIPVGLLLLSHFQQVLLGVEVSSEEDRRLRHPTRPVKNVMIMMKGLQERTQLFEWDDGES